MDNKFKPDTSTPKSVETKIPEYSFDEGVDVCVAKIQELMKTLNRNVFVVINGSSINVGKTVLLGAIQQRLSLLDIDRTGKKVIFETEQDKLYTTGRNYRDDLTKINPDLQTGVIGDFYIGIYSPDKPFLWTGKGKMSPVADIMIRNEYAKNSLDKF